MAITYNNLYMDIRQELHRAGIQAATLEARELVCFAAGKTREQFVRDGRLYVPQDVEEQARALMRRHLAGEPLAYLIGEWEVYGLPRHLRAGAHPPQRHGGARGRGDPLAADAAGRARARPLRGERLRGAGRRVAGTRLPRRPRREVRGRAAHLPAEHPP